MRISRDCFANFVADFRTTFVRVWHECRENFLVSRTRREVFQHVEKFYANFFSKMFRKTVAQLSCDGRVTVVRRSRDVRACVANMSPRNLGEFTMRNFCDTRTNVTLVSHGGRATFLRKPRDYLARK